MSHNNIDNPCCEKMARALTDAETPITLIRRFREYGVKVMDGGESHIIIEYCPWCGAKLPSSLRHRWFDELELLGIDPESDPLPETFSDERWYRGT